MPDLSTLTAAEQNVLRLLACGHTAKSAATALGLTEGAVNERLREARRKTGVGSSRELARHVAASQEIWDEKIGMATAAPPAQSDGRTLIPRARWPLILGGLAMTVIASAVGALAALALAGHSAPPAGPPRVVETYPAPGAVVPAGALTLKVVFDQPMRASWSFVNRDAATTPACDGRPVQSADRKSFTMTCRVEAGRAYWIGFNSGNHRNFATPEGVPATPAGLAFSAR